MKTNKQEIQDLIRSLDKTRFVILLVESDQKIDSIVIQLKAPWLIHQVGIHFDKTGKLLTLLEQFGTPVQNRVKGYKNFNDVKELILQEFVNRK